MTAAYPLTWPEHIERTKYREAGKFKTTLAGALRNVQDSLRRFATDSGKKVENIILSSNVTLGAERPTDPGVAVWFVWDGIQVCIPVDRYSTPAANLQAIHHVLEARRVELRHGTLALVRASFRGFQALPPPSQRAPWWTVLGVAETASAAEVETAYRTKAKEHHPDRGGRPEMMATINRAREEALKARKT